MRRSVHRYDPDKNVTSKKLKALAAERGRTIKTQAHVCLVQGASDADADRIVEGFREGADLEAIANVYDGGFQGDKQALGFRDPEPWLSEGAVLPRLCVDRRLRRIADFIEDMAENGDFDGMLFSFPDYVEA